MKQPAPAYEGEEPYVFVSYSHQDEALVNREIRWLQDHGIKVWYDTQIQAGSEWSDALANAIGGCSRFLYFITPNSVESENCRRELNHAIEEDRSILAVHLRETNVPGGIRLNLNNRQAILKYRLKSDDYRSILMGALSMDGPGPEPPVTVAASSANRSFPLVAAALAATLLVAVAAIMLWPGTPVDDPALTESTGGAEAPHEAYAEPSLAVLPFSNLSADPDQEYFSDGLTGELVSSLARNPSIIIRPSASSFALKNSKLALPEIGRRLDVTHVLEGGVQRSGGRIRVTLQLSNVDTNQTIWSDRFEGDMADIFVLQDEISEKVFRALGTRLTDNRPGRVFASDEAYDAFMRARAHFDAYEYEAAEHWYEIATTLDPLNADAWAGRALNLGIQVWAGTATPRQMMRKVADYNQRALEIDPQQPYALEGKAINSFFAGDHQSAVNQIVALAHLYPNQGQLMLLYILGAVQRFDLADRAAVHWGNVAPLTASFNWRIEMLMGGGAMDKAKALVDEYGLQMLIPNQQALYSIYTGDLEALHQMLSSEGAWHPAIRPFFMAIYHYLSGQVEDARQVILPFKADPENLSFMIRHSLALIDGDVAAGLRFYREAIIAGEPQATIPYGIGYVNVAWRNTFPEFYPVDEYESLLREFSLDKESLEKIEVPPLPF